MWTDSTYQACIKSVLYRRLVKKRLVMIQEMEMVIVWYGLDGIRLLRLHFGFVVPKLTKKR